MATLDDICPTNQIQIANVNRVMVSDSNLASMRTRERKGVGLRNVTLRYKALTSTQIQTLRGKISAVGKSGPIRFTLPTESAAAYRVRLYEDRTINANNFTARIELEELKGIKPPVS